MTTIPATLIPADLFPGLLDAADLGVEAYVGPDTGWIPCPMVNGHAAFALHSGLPKRLDLTHWTAQHALVRALAVGEKCPHCDGTGRGSGGSDGIREPGEPPSGCEWCGGDGWKRPPHNLRAFLPAPFGDAQAEWTAGLLGCSARRVARGLPPVAAIVEPCGGDHYRVRAGRVLTSDGFEAHYGHRDMCRGSRAALLANAIAIAERDGSLVLPEPTEAPDAR